MLEIVERSCVTLVAILALFLRRDMRCSVLLVSFAHKSSLLDCWRRGSGKMPCCECSKTCPVPLAYSRSGDTSSQFGRLEVRGRSLDVLLPSAKVVAIP